MWSFAHLQLRLSDRNKMVLWPGCAGCSLHKTNVRLVRFIVKRRGRCCNLSIGFALNVQFTTNGMCVKNNTHIQHMWHKQAIKEWSWHVISGNTNKCEQLYVAIAYAKSVHGMWFWLLLLPQCEVCALVAQAFRLQQHHTCYIILYVMYFYANFHKMLTGLHVFVAGLSSLKSQR